MNDAYNPPGPVPPRSRNPLPSGSIVGDFTVGDLVSEGRVGLVYRAVDNVTQREVAFKEYMPAGLAGRGRDGRVELHSPQHEAVFQAGLASFVDEAKLLARFEHKALVKVLRVFEAHETAYVVMPLYEGSALGQVLRESPRVDEPWIKAMLAPLLDALEMLHGARRFHGDVSPESILILEDGGPVLLGFAAARRVIGGTTAASTDVFNAGFAPVEQYGGESAMRLGPWTDVYALAAVARLAITGKVPPPSVTRVARDPMRPLAQTATRFGPSFLRAVDYGLAVQPDDRPKTIAEFRRALGLAVVSVGLPTHAPAAMAATLAVAPERMAAVPKPLPASSPSSVATTRPLKEGAPMQMRGSLPTSAPGARPSLASPSAAASLASSPRQRLPMALVLVTMLVIAGAGYLVMQAVTSGSSRERIAGAAPTAPVTSPRTPEPAAEPPAAAPEPPPAAPDPTPAAATPPPDAPQSADAPAAAAAPPVAVQSPDPPMPVTGLVMLNVKPWAEVLVDGRARGLTPPLKVLRLREGGHRIEVRNPAGPPMVRDVEVTASGRVEIRHTFN